MVIELVPTKHVIYSKYDVGSSHKDALGKETFKAVYD